MAEALRKIMQAKLQRDPDCSLYLAERSQRGFHVRIRNTEYGIYIAVFKDHSIGTSLMWVVDDGVDYMEVDREEWKYEGTRHWDWNIDDLFAELQRVAALATAESNRKLAGSIV